MEQNICGFVVEHCMDHEYFTPRMKRPCLPLPAVQAATTKMLTTNLLTNVLTPENYQIPCIIMHNYM